MLDKKWLDLQFFAEGAAAGDGGAAGASSADAGQSTGASSADAGQSFEARLEELGVPKGKIRKGAYKRAEQTLPQKTAGEAQPAAAEEKTPESAGGDAERKPWNDIKGEYKAEYDAEVQKIVTSRLKGEQARVKQYADREDALAPMTMFFADRYKLDPDDPEFAKKLVEKFRADSSISQSRAIENGREDELQHKLDMAKADEDAHKLQEQRNQQLKEAFNRAASVRGHLSELNEQAAELRKKIPSFDLAAELKNGAFFIMTQPGSPVTVEQAYYALHPEYREQEAQAIAKKATEAVSASVRAGMARPDENGTQAASVGNTRYRDRPRQEREALKKRIYEAGLRGEKLPFGS